MDGPLSELFAKENLESRKSRSNKEVNQLILQAMCEIKRIRFILQREKNLQFLSQLKILKTNHRGLKKGMIVHRKKAVQ
jgi:hypothetical protein